MPEIQRKKREPNQPEVEDIIVKIGNFRLYFQNYYTIISLANDLLLGGLYFIGSLASLLGWPQWIRQYSFLAGAFFMLMRPILKIIRNIFIYDEQEFKEEVIQSKFWQEQIKKKSVKQQRNEGTHSNYGVTFSQKEKMKRIDKAESEENSNRSKDNSSNNS